MTLKETLGNVLYDKLNAKILDGRKVRLVSTSGKRSGRMASRYCSGDSLAVFQVFADYVDDSKNTDNAWVEITVLNMHLDRASPVLVDVENVVRTRTFARWRDRCLVVTYCGAPRRSRAAAALFSGSR